MAGKQPLGDDSIQFLQEEMQLALRGMLNERLDLFEQRLNKVEAAQKNGGGGGGAGNPDLAEELKAMKAKMSESETKVAELAQATVLRTSEMAVAGTGTDMANKPSRVSWNELGSMGADSLQINIDDNVQAAAQDSNDLTVDKWNFRQSCWDSVAFIFDTQLMTTPESLYVVYLLGVNCVIQVCFIIIVFASLSSTALDKDAIEGFHLWRTNVGHNSEFTNPFTEESLAGRVCRGDTSLHLSDTQTETVRNINHYLYDNAPFNGPLMCLLATCTWILTVSKEFHALKDQFFALRQIPLGGTQVMLDQKVNRLELVQMAGCRIGWISFLSVVRFCIASALLTAGVMFLAVTLSIEDILLNAVALEFVLQVDELLYLALAPMKTRRLLLLLKPLRLKRPLSAGGLDLNIFVASTFVFGFLSMVFVVFMMPEMERMKDAKAEMCDGFTGWSYSTTALGTLTWAPAVADAVAANAKMYKSTKYKTLRNIIAKGGAANQSDWRYGPGADLYMAVFFTPSIFGPGWSVDTIRTLELGFLGSTYNGDCTDVNPPASIIEGVFYAALQDSSGNYSIKDCSGVTKTWCNTLTAPGPQVRMMCPHTCGCDNPMSSLIMPNPVYGCPDECKYSIAWKKIAYNRSCTEALGTELAAFPAIKESMSMWVNVVQLWPEKAQGLYLLAVKGLVAKYGCYGLTIIKMKYGVNICKPFRALQLFNYYCPKTCNCAEIWSPGCPESCRKHQGSVKSVSMYSPEFR